MSVTFGFYNAINGDRRYDAIEMARIFDGIIRDGVYQHLGDALQVVQGEGMSVIVKTGRAWFNHTWTLNDALLPLEIEPSELIATRIDAVVIDVNAKVTARENAIKVIKGPVSSQGSAQRPTLIQDDGEEHWQYPLCYITIPPESIQVSQTNMVNMIGTSNCPYVTGPLEAMEIDEIVAQWEAKFMDWFNQLEEDLSGNPVGNIQVQLNRMKALRFATLKATGWTASAPYTQVLPLLGYLDGDTPFIQCINTPTSKQNKTAIQKQWNFVDSIKVEPDKMTATCLFEKPTIDLQLVIKGR